MDHNYPLVLQDILDGIKENPDYLQRLTKIGSDFINDAWKAFLTYYMMLSTVTEKKDQFSSYLLDGTDVDNLFKKDVIGVEELWQLLDMINLHYQNVFENADKGRKSRIGLLPVKVKSEETSSDSDSNSSSLATKFTDFPYLSSKGTRASVECDLPVEKNDNDSIGSMSENESDCSEVEHRNDESKIETLSQGKNNLKKNLDIDNLDHSEASDIDSNIFFDDRLMIDDGSETEEIKYDDFMGDEEVKEPEDLWKEESDSEAGNIEKELEEGFLSSEEDQKHSENFKSPHELKLEKLNKRISKLEENALKEKPWPLKGEVDATQRPLNSLLEEVVEVDLSQRPAPVITKEVTLKLEDIILKRIKDKAFDDVEKKLKPVESVHEFKKAIVLDQEKSKLSLAEIYEKEYLKQKNESTTEKEDEKLSPDKEEVLKMMQTLFKKLDTLSNFHFTPRPAVPEIKIVSNLPAITVEEVGPDAVAHGNLLAPEEISGVSKRELMSKDERSTTDKKRERRKKKKLQRLRAERANKSSKASVKSLTKNVGTKILTEDNQKLIKSSKNFFTKLQDDVENPTSKKRKPGKASENKSSDIKKLKL